MSKPIKLIQSLAGAENGGAENFYTRLTCALQERPEIDQIAFTRPWPRRMQLFGDANVKVQNFRFGGRFDFIDHYRYRQALKAAQPDIVLTYMTRATSMTPKGDYKLIARLGHFYNLNNYRHCDYWIGNTKGICDHLIQGGMPADKVFHIANFADQSALEPLPKDSFDTPVDQPLVLAVGRLHVNKAFDTLLRAFKRVPEGTLWLAGEGPERDSLEVLCDELGLRSRVRFLGWRNDINALMQTADLFVCPSRHEGLGSIVLESWLNQCPIVATASQGPAELIDDGETGLLTPIDEPDKLAEAINQLLRNPGLAKQLAENAHASYQRTFSREAITSQYVELFQSICGR